MLSRAAKKHKLPLFSHNKRQPNHTEMTSGGVISFNGLALRGPVRNFTIAEEGHQNPDSFFRFSTPPYVLDQVDYRAVCQTRDIRDLVVAQYVSHGWIHPPADGFGEMRRNIQSGEIGLFDYALLEFEGKSEFGQESIIEKYRKLRQFRERLGAGNTLVLQYEDMVNSYDKWAGRISDFLSDWLDFRPILQKLRPRYRFDKRHDEFFPDPREYVRTYRRKMKHIRSPAPGDHRRFFSEPEIDRLRTIIRQYDPQPENPSLHDIASAAPCEGNTF